MLTLDIVTPESELISAEVDMVIVPGEEGEIGVLPKHAPLITSLKPGVVKLYKGNNITDKIFVKGGTAEINETRCTVLATIAEFGKDINASEAKEAVNEISYKVPAAKGEERVKLEFELEVATAKVEASS